jgi:hypothetical protein
MLSVPRATSNVLATGVAVLGLLSAPATIRAEPRYPPAIEAGFRGCDSAGWCRFAIDALDPSSSPYRVRPDGVLQTPVAGIAIAVRDRLNALLASMIHQHKRIVLHGLRELDDGTFAATVTVNDLNLASDPILVELRANVTGMAR